MTASAIEKVTKAGGERIAWSIAEVCEKLGVSRNFLLGQISKRSLRARKLGRRVVVLNEDLAAYLRDSEQVSRGR